MRIFNGRKYGDKNGTCEICNGQNIELWFHPFYLMYHCEPCYDRTARSEHERK